MLKYIVNDKFFCSTMVSPLTNDKGTTVVSIDGKKCSLTVVKKVKRNGNISKSVKF